MRIIMHHPQKEDLKIRMITELTDSVGMCFTGRINRMVNALVGFVDRVTVSISKKEEVNINVSQIVHRLMEHKIKKEDAITEMTVLFIEAGTAVDENFKNANILALDDFDD
jgi:hypothetical protein